MLTLLLYVVLAIVVVVVLFVLASNFLPAGEQIAPALRDEPIWTLPHGSPVRGEDIDEVKLPVAIRGYRFAETDALLDLLAEQLRERDREIARLRGGGYATAGPSGASVWARPAADDAVSDEALAVPADGSETEPSEVTPAGSAGDEKLSDDRITTDADAGLSSETTSDESYDERRTEVAAQDPSGARSQPRVPFRRRRRR